MSEQARMLKIAIIGSPGGGKSWLTARLGEVLNLPVHHLDRLHWRPGWQAPPRDEWHALQRKILAEPAWIVDGNYGGTLDLRLGACDTVIWLDMPTWVCLLGVLERYFTFQARSRPDMAEGCPERLNWTFLWWIVSFRHTSSGQPRILRALHALPPSKAIITLTSRREVARWLQQLGVVPPLA